MQLLVSVRSELEAHRAVAGGADVIDAKEPLAGALGPVALSTFAQIVNGVAGCRPVSAALGDLSDAAVAGNDAHAFARAGAAFVKAGLAGIDSDRRVESLLVAAAVGAAAGGAGLVAVAYADHAETGALPPANILHAAVRAGARGVLLDTAAKDGPALFELIPADELAAWVGCAHAAGLFTAVAGRLVVGDLAAVIATGADVVGIRGAACDGGRDGQISVAKVRGWQAALRGRTPHTPSTEYVVAASRGNGDRR